MNHVPQITTLLLLTMLISCGKSDDTPPDDDWAVGTTGHKLVQGKYAVEYRIKQDSCTPSLQGILETSRFTPSSSAYVELSSESSENASYFFAQFSRLRERDLIAVEGQMRVGANVLDRLTSFNDFLGEFQPRCSDTELALRRYDNAETAYSEQDNVLHVNMFRKWHPLEKPCSTGQEPVYEIDRIADMFVPREACVEEYEVILTLVEECPQDCEVRRRYTPQGEGELRRTIFDESEPWCVCPDSEEATE